MWNIDNLLSKELREIIKLCSVHNKVCKIPCSVHNIIKCVKYCTMHPARTSARRGISPDFGSVKYDLTASFVWEKKIHHYSRLRGNLLANHSIIENHLHLIKKPKNVTNCHFDGLFRRHPAQLRNNSSVETPDSLKLEHLLEAVHTVLVEDLVRYRSYLVLETSLDQVYRIDCSCPTRCRSTQYNIKI